MNKGMNETKGTAKEMPLEQAVFIRETQESPECVPHVTELQHSSQPGCQEGTVPHTSHVWEQRQSEASFRSPRSLAPVAPAAGEHFVLLEQQGHSSTQSMTGSDIPTTIRNHQAKSTAATNPGF